MQLKSEADIFMSTLRVSAVCQSLARRERISYQPSRSWILIWLFLLLTLKDTFVTEVCSLQLNKYFHWHQWDCLWKAGKKRHGPWLARGLLHILVLSGRLCRCPRPIKKGTRFCHLTYSWAASLYIFFVNNTAEHSSVWAWGWGSSFTSKQRGF